MNSSTQRQEDSAMYVDNAVIFGLGAVALSVAFMAGWIAFIIRDAHRRKR
jgi:hypothetical protein|tara:strand:- start:153 stop:302 length:150 start_codon:yes stop_codon:yes gene_type:complete